LDNIQQSAELSFFNVLEVRRAELLLCLGVQARKEYLSVLLSHFSAGTLTWKLNVQSAKVSQINRMGTNLVEYLIFYFCIFHFCLLILSAPQIIRIVLCSLQKVRLSSFSRGLESTAKGKKKRKKTNRSPADQ